MAIIVLGNPKGNNLKETNKNKEQGIVLKKKNKLVFFYEVLFSKVIIGIFPVPQEFLHK